ncbi:MAG: YegS/Rv2252/BmrU family lipid kinase [Vulcanimicrobiaceae bacterium]
MTTLPDLKKAVVVIGNLHSRNTQTKYARAIELLTERGVTIASSQTVDRGDEMVARVRSAVAAGHRYVLVAGGDGSMTSVVGEFAHKEAVLGVLPLGTGNSFAQTLGIEPTLEAAVDTIVSGRVARVDLGIVNGKHFANFATIGLSSTIARATSNRLKKVLGPLAYAVAGVAPLLRSSSFDAHVTWETGNTRVRTHQLIIANGRYFGFTPILPDASIVDGELSLFTTSGCSRWEIARMFVAFQRHRQTTLADAEYFSASEITVTAQPKQYLDVDGEAFGETPATFAIDARALRVLVPQNFTGLD